MFAIFISYDGLHGHFHPSVNGDPLVSTSEWGKQELIKEQQCIEYSQLVELPYPWRLGSVTSVESLEKFRCPPDVLAYDNAA